MNRFESLRLTAEELRAELRKIVGPVDGFCRFSDAEEPVMLHGEPLPEIPEAGSSFLFELAVCTEKFGIGVRQYNDFWLFSRVDWEVPPPRKPGSGADYLVYREYTKARKGLLFYTQYLPKKNNAGFDVLTPAWNIFIGFGKED